MYISKGTIIQPLSLRKDEFDNVILIIFLSFMSFLIILGVFFVDLTHSTAKSSQPASEETPISDLPITV